MTINATVNVTKRRIIARANMPGLTAYKNFAPSVPVQCIDCANREKSNKRMRETLKLLLNPIIL